MMKLPYLLVSDSNGNIFELPPYLMTGMSLDTPVLPNDDDLIEIPYGSNLFMLPERIPVGYDPRTNKFTEVPEYRGNLLYPVSAFMAPAYMQILRSAYISKEGAVPLPLYAYTACGWKEGKFFVSGIRVDPDTRQDLKLFNCDDIDRKARLLRKKFSRNRLICHLIDLCVYKYGCPAARNFVLSRWECPVPTSPYCNSRCVGCISKQQKGSGIVPSQERIDFIPDVRDIVELIMHHLSIAPLPVISFGQGCEGEPLLVGDVIEEAIRTVRKKTNRGIINFNTNGSKPEIVERLICAGLDSIRVSTNSARQYFYNRYYRPEGYIFEDVVESLRIIRHYGKWASINYFIFPGFTDHRDEMAALDTLIGDVKINMIQTRNINIDPEIYIRETGCGNLENLACGLRNWLSHIKKSFPWIKLGYFNPPKEEMKERHFRFC
jgi:pyruvate-formate lyase-activating enzyme